MYFIIGVWRSPVARYVRDVEAVGSNPTTPTWAISFGLHLITNTLVKM